MKVTITDENNRRVEIASGNEESPSNLAIEETREKQVATGLRWKRRKVFDRGNKGTRVSFQVHRVHETLGAAERFILTHQTDVPNQGLVEFKLVDDSSLYLDASMIEAITVSHVGVSTSHTYTIEGGEISAVKP